MYRIVCICIDLICFLAVSSVMRDVSINTNMSCVVTALYDWLCFKLNIAELNDRDRASAVRAVIYDGSKILISYFELLYLNCTSATLNRNIIAILHCYEKK
ncbi:hypothetical protein T08_5518 [Trichinella sp. T8]|nr:hypothetical protein T08_5518 [Trichinella sp. T8]